MVYDFTHVSYMATSSHKSKVCVSTSKKHTKSVHIVPEEKWYDYTTLSGSIGQNPAAWSNYYVPAIVQGTSVHARVGNQIVARKLEVHTGVSRNSGGTTVQRVRIMVIRNKDPVGAATPPGDIFSTSSLFDPMRNPDFISNYVIMFCKEYVLDSAVANFLPVEISLGLNFVTRFSANGGIVSDVAQNNIELVVWSDQAANQPTLAGGSFRFTFTDE